MPGPLDRTTFYAEQRRNRRAAWPLFLLSALSVAAMGIPFSLVVTPFLFIVVLVVLGATALVHPVPNQVWTTLQSFGLAVIQVMQHALDPKSSPAPDPAVVEVALRAMFLPGVIALLAAWLALRALFSSAGVGGVLLTLNARAPDTSDLKEMQLVDVAEEIAIAAGVRPPRVVLLDSPAANAAIVGSSIDDSTLIISRGLLQQLQRDELQAVVAHLVGSAGNGDLGMGMMLASVFQSFGLITTFVNAPFGPRARSILWTMLRAVTVRQPAERATLTSQAMQALSGAGDFTSGSDLDDRMSSGSKKEGPIEAARGCLLVPFGMLNFTLRFIVWVFSTALVKPALALVWRTRRYLADATAVKLTRDPDALAHALAKLAQTGQVVAAGNWTSLLFIVGPEARRAATARILRRAREMQAAEGQGAGKDYNPTVLAAVREELASAQNGNLSPEVVKQIEKISEARAAALQALRTGNVEQVRLFAATVDKTGFSGATQSDREGGLLSFHPPLYRRLQRLQRLGASVDAEAARPRPAWLSLLIGLLMILMGILLVIALVLSIGLSIVFMGGFLGVIAMLFKLLAAVLH